MAFNALQAEKIDGFTVVHDPTIKKMFSKYPVWCYAIILLAVLDVFTTAWFLSLGASEGNPIFVVLLANGMALFAVVFKFLLTITGMYLAYILAESSLMIGTLNVFNAAGMACFTSSVVMLAFIVAVNGTVIFDCMNGGVFCV